MMEAFGHGAHGSLPWPALVAAWTGMMAAMMAPTTVPWVRAFHAFPIAGARVAALPRRGARAVATAMFAGGYLTAWLAYSAAIAAAQAGLLRAGLLHPVHGMPDPWGGLLLLGAALVQGSPLKRACLTHCRNPFTFLLQRWHDGPIGGFRLGLWHGLFCVGCCWALMATALAVGVTSLGWMALLAVAVFVEQVVPGGARARVPIGVALGAAGVWRLIA
jgi:predicted metal-binding membrane protein